MSTSTLTKPDSPAPPVSSPTASFSLLPRTTIGTKYIVALTGLGLLLFVIGHMVGNLQVFLGRDALNAYAEKLKGMPALLWVVRIGLLAIFVLHIFLAVKLKLRNRQARPSRYVIDRTTKASKASLTMIWSGLAILFFVIYHLLHFTIGVTNPTYFDQEQTVEKKVAINVDDKKIEGTETKERHDVYSMVVLSFRDPFISGTYILAMLFLGMHLIHATPGMFQTLGMQTEHWQQRLHRLGVAVAVIIVVGNISMPLLILLRVVPL